MVGWGRLRQLVGGWMEVEVEVHVAGYSGGFWFYGSDEGM